MGEEVLVVLNKKDPTSGLGFSLLGTPGLPPIIYNVLENSPAAESGQMEAGDVILNVNEIDVEKFSTKEVLKCLRLSGNTVSLKLKKDPIVKLQVKDLLCKERRNEEGSTQRKASPPSPPLPVSVRGASTCEQPTSQPIHTPKFEAFVMTGDRVLKICPNPQGSAVLSHQNTGDSSQEGLIHSSCSVSLRHNSVPNSPIENERHTSGSGGNSQASPPPKSSYTVRNSKSEDHLQLTKESMSTVLIDVDDDVTSSLNTLLSTNQDEDQRIVWTYNAPLSSDSSPAESPQDSPTSVSSSVMSSDSSSSSESDKKIIPSNCGGSSVYRQVLPPDLSQSEAVSNISSPDFQEEDSEIIGRDLMEVSDPSDSDSTLMVSETNKPSRRKPLNSSDLNQDHRIIIQVKGVEKINELNRSNSLRSNRLSHASIKEEEDLEYQSEGYQDVLHEDDANLVQLSEGAANLARSVSPPQDSGQDSDDSLHSFHCSPKAVDKPSAIRLAKRLYTLDGFKKSDVSRHLSKNNEFNRVVAEEYLNYFEFAGEDLDAALRKFLLHFCLTGETQERERVLVHFSKRYLDCNPKSFTSQDAVHTLTCAIMLLNTDLHCQVIGRKMACNEFIENLTDLNDGQNFPREVLRSLYQSIRNHPLEWAQDSEGDDNLTTKSSQDGGIVSTPKGIYDVPPPAVEYKKGYVMRKCCVGPNGKKTPLGKRGWKMFYCTLRDLVLYLHKDERGFDRKQVSDNIHNAIRIHHSLASKASDYTKHLHVFRLETADQAVYLFQTSDSKELQSWVDTINYVSASLSAQALPSAVGSQTKFQRPLLPSSHTKLNVREQLRDHEETIKKLEADFEHHRKYPPDRGAKSSMLSYKEKEAYLQNELKRYKSYSWSLRSRLCGEYLGDTINEGALIESIGESGEEGNFEEKLSSNKSH